VRPDDVAGCGVRAGVRGVAGGRVVLRDLVGGQMSGPRAICKADGCDRPTGRHQRGFCSPMCRFWAKLQLAGECWEWTGAKHDEHGYGTFVVGGGHWRAHRWSYTQFIADIPSGYEIDHLCRNPPCVNPYHLEAVTTQVHHKRTDASKWQRAKTHCPQGHPYSGDNLRRTPKGRYCRACNFARHARTKAALLASRAAATR
jgi:hypothetical protein